MNFKDIQTKVAATSREHGFWDVQVLKNPATVDRKLMLIVSELAEAQEDWRNGVFHTVLRADGKPHGFASELADAVIRIMDLAAQMGIDLEHEILQKDKYNESRPFKHGRKY